VASDAWALIHAERESLAADLDGLTAEQWAVTSLCSEWSVHQVLGHIVATTKMTPPKFFAQFAVARFNFTAFNAKNVARNTQPTPAATLAEFRAHLLDTTAPPGPTETMVGEIVVHGADIRRPLGIHYTPPTATVVRAAEFYQRSNLIVGGKDRITGLTLRATDADWVHGNGPEVTGPMLALVLAMTGRGVALTDLTGTGVPTLTERIATR
jgi:uncharacterized protein (TIGR03083 family)